jgi:hypothetical protein
MTDTQVLYAVPMATWPVRIIMGAVCLLFVATIFGWWAPRVVPRLLNFPRTSLAQFVPIVAIAVIPLVIGFGPLAVLIALIRNPMAYVTHDGVVKESVFSQTPTSFTWEEIARVICRSRGEGDSSWFSLVAADGRRIDLGNGGNFDSMRILFENQLGPKVMHGCPH